MSCSVELNMKNSFITSALSDCLKFNVKNLVSGLRDKIQCKNSCVTKVRSIPYLRYGMLHTRVLIAATHNKMT